MGQLLVGSKAVTWFTSWGCTKGLNKALPHPMTRKCVTLWRRNSSVWQFKYTSSWIACTLKTATNAKPNFGLCHKFRSLNPAGLYLLLSTARSEGRTSLASAHVEVLMAYRCHAWLGKKIQYDATLSRWWTSHDCRLVTDWPTGNRGPNVGLYILVEETLTFTRTRF